MLIGGKEYKTGQRIKVINAKSILHYKYGMTGDCNKDMTGITGVITAESTYDEYARANLRVDEPYSEHYRNGMTIFTAHCPYELGDIVEVAIIEGMAITGYPRRLGTAEMQITDIITEHSLKNGTVSFIYELDGKKRMRLIPWNELTKRSEKH